MCNFLRLYSTLIHSLLVHPYIHPFINSLTRLFHGSSFHISVFPFIQSSIYVLSILPIISFTHQLSIVDNTHTHTRARARTHTHTHTHTITQAVTRANTTTSVANLLNAWRIYTASTDACKLMQAHPHPCSIAPTRPSHRQPGIGIYCFIDW